MKADLTHLSCDSQGGIKCFGTLQTWHFQCRVVDVGTPADFAQETEGGSFKMDKKDFNRAFPDTYNVHGFVKAGISKDELNDDPELKKKMPELINYVDRNYPEKENWILVKESNLKDFNDYSIRDPEVKSDDLIKDSELYVNGERFYVADYSETDPDSY